MRNGGCGQTTTLPFDTGRIKFGKVEAEISQKFENSLLLEVGGGGGVVIVVPMSGRAHDRAGWEDGNLVRRSAPTCGKKLYEERDKPESGDTEEFHNFKIHFFSKIGVGHVELFFLLCTQILR